MIVRWEQGRDVIDQLLAQGRLQRVAPNRALADHYLERSALHSASAQAIELDDVVGSFSLSYDAARLALSAILLCQGLRTRGEGAHAVLLEAALAQLEPPRQRELREFGWMRRVRNDSQYPDGAHPIAHPRDAAEAIVAGQRILGRARHIVPMMPVYD